MVVFCPGSWPDLLALAVVFCATALGSKPARLLIVSFDGFRYDYVNNSLTPHLMALRQRGTYAHYMVNVFPTKTYPNHHSLATGVYVESHGVFGSRMRDNDIVFEYSQQMFAYNKTVLPIWIVNQQAGRYSGSMMWLGGEFVYNNTVATLHRVLEAGATWEGKVDTVMQWFKNSTTPANVVMVYFNQPDYTSHRTGSDSQEVRAQIVNVDNIVKYLEDALRHAHLDDVNVFLLSDHGMADVLYKNIIDLRPENNRALDGVKDHYSIIGSSPIFQVLPRVGSEELVYQAFHSLAQQKGGFTVYRKAELPPAWHVSKLSTIPAIVIVAKLGHGFHDLFRKFDIGPGGARGVHGYDNNLIQMHPFFQAFGPDIKRNHVIAPFNNVDLFSLWCHLIDVKDVQSDGDIKNVHDMLANRKVSDRSPDWLVLKVMLLFLLKM